MKHAEGVEVWLHFFTTRPLKALEETLEPFWILGGGGKKNLIFLPGLEPRIVQFVTYSLYRLHYPGS